MTAPLRCNYPAICGCAECDHRTYNFFNTKKRLLRPDQYWCGVHHRVETKPNVCDMATQGFNDVDWDPDGTVETTSAVCIDGLRRQFDKAITDVRNALKNAETAMDMLIERYHKAVNREVK